MKKKLIGQWKLNTESVKATMTTEFENQTSDDQTNEMAEVLMQMVDGMTMIIEFSTDNTITVTTTVMGEEQTQESEWTLDSIEGNTITLMVEEQPSIIVLI
ncbi:MAG: hypothetical protein PF495_01500, partial [Spirochaetales bacterium]|nr:hypothetical protein [Spirochaetales bacterium]